MTAASPPSPGFSLEALQHWMQGALFDPRRVAPEEPGRRLVAGPRLTAAQGLAIYQRSYFLRIAACMREQFPALCHALGRELFDDFVADYIRARPPESHTLYDLGRRFPGHLEETRPDRDAAPADRETWIDFMTDLARYERQLFVMFDAPGHEGGRFAGPGTPDARLRLQPAFDLGGFRFPVADYYHAVRRGEAPPLPPLAPSFVAPSFVALVRTDYVTRTLPLTESHFVFLGAMRDGGGIEDALAAVAGHVGQPVEDVRRAWRDPDGVRRRWIEAGIFVEAG